MPRVVFFDVAADDPERAIGFYRDVFGWKIEKWPGPMPTGTSFRRRSPSASVGGCCR